MVWHETHCSPPPFLPLPAPIIMITPPVHTHVPPSTNCTAFMPSFHPYLVIIVHVVIIGHYWHYYVTGLKEFGFDQISCI